MPKRILSSAQRRRLTYLRQKVREAGLTLHTPLRRINLAFGASLDQLDEKSRAYTEELIKLGHYQVQFYIPSADPRQDQRSPLINSLYRTAA